MESASPRPGTWRTGSAFSSSLASFRSKPDQLNLMRYPMKAALLQAFGGADLITVGEIGSRDLGPNDALVRVEVAGANPLDLKIIAGYMQQAFPVDFPYIPGTDFSGVVDAVGAKV